MTKRTFKNLLAALWEVHAHASREREGGQYMAKTGTVTDKLTRMGVDGKAIQLVKRVGGK